MTYTASKTRSQRAGWSVTFRHPAVANPETGKPGKRVRYGLGTREDEAADALVAQLNELLADDRWWSQAAQAQAADRFDGRVIDIFFGPMQAETTDSRLVRDELLPLPVRSDGYRTILLAGTTGAGKTTVLRQLIGTDPVEERFPTTATGRTTIADTEVVLDDGDYRAAVTFFSFDEVSHHLEDCVLQAVVAAYRQEPREEVRRSLLRHRDERFRFNYVLGEGEQETTSPALASASFARFSQARPDSGMPELGTLEADDAPRVVEALVDRVIALASRQAADIERELGPATTDDDARALIDLIEEGLDTRLRDDDEVHDLTDSMLDEMRKRFDLIGDVGELRRTRQGWPVSWTWNTADREAFIRHLRRFTSNSKLGFGRLLTPLVDGVRVAGPFGPTWNEGGSAKLVLLDTEGLGHTVDTASSISTKLTRLVTEADAVVLVDNAEQPMQAAPATFLRALARTGHGAKLHVCFTHFDAVEGDNLPTPADRAMHVLNACEGILSKIGSDLGAFAERPLRARLRDASFFLANCHRALEPETDELSVDEFRRLLASLERSGERPTLADTRPIYDRTNLVVAVRDAVEGFHRHWDALLGRAVSPDVQKAHWATVKALSRRFAVMNQDEYKNLQPVANLQAWLQDQAWLMLQSPVGWTSGDPSVDEKQALYDELANRLSERLLDLAHQRLSAEHHQQWLDAFLRSGPGSTRVRSGIIADQIYATAAPIPQATPAPQQNEFLHQVIELVRATTNELGVELR